MQAFNIRLADGTTVKVQDWSYYNWYSLCRFDTVQNQPIMVYNYRQGQPVSDGSATIAAAANKIHTNIPEAGTVPAGQEFRVYSMQMEIPQYIPDVPVAGDGPPVLGDVQQILALAHFRFVTGVSSIKIEGTPAMFPFAGNLWADTTLNATTVLNIGTPGQVGAKQLAVPIILEGKENYAGHFEFPWQGLNMTNDTDVKVHLVGLWKRPLSAT